MAVVEARLKIESWNLNSNETSTAFRVISQGVQQYLACGAEALLNQQALTTGQNAAQALKHQGWSTNRALQACHSVVRYTCAAS